MSTYTYCPYCLKQATARTRGIPTFDLCALGHRWLVADGITPKPLPYLNSCAYCKSSDVRVNTNLADTTLGAYQGWCCACGARGPKKPTEAEAIEAWNRSNDNA